MVALHDPAQAPVPAAARLRAGRADGLAHRVRLLDCRRRGCRGVALAVTYAHRSLRDPPTRHPDGCPHPEARTGADLHLHRRRPSRRPGQSRADRHQRQLASAFKAMGWTQADALGLASSWRMAKAFVLNRPYPAAPFSTLYLFGRGQDVGFQCAIDNSPRKRHHVRFWGCPLDRSEDAIDTPASGSRRTRRRTASRRCGSGPSPRIQGCR